MIIVNNLLELNKALEPHKDKKVAGAFSQYNSPVVHQGFQSIVAKCNEVGDITVCVYHSLVDLRELLYESDNYKKESIYKEELLEYWSNSSIQPDIIYFEDTDEFLNHYLEGLSLSEAYVESDKVWDLIVSQHEVPNPVYQEVSSRIICLYTRANRKQNGVNRLYHLDLMVMSSKEGYRRFVSKWFNEYYGFEYHIIEPLTDFTGMPYEANRNEVCDYVQLGKAYLKLNEKITKEEIEEDTTLKVKSLTVHNLGADGKCIDAYIMINTKDHGGAGPVLVSKWIRRN